VGDTTILERMLAGIQAAGVVDVVLVLGYLHHKVERVVQQAFADMNVQVIVNDHYAETNTGYSLLLAAEMVEGSAFVKFDGDVVFDPEILRRLLSSPGDNALCIDRNIQLASEEVKVALSDGTRVSKVSKNLAPADAVGESIGIEKISADTADLLFSELRTMMEHQRHLQDYYEGAYERLIDRGVPFHAVDITGLPWTEIDTQQDYDAANALFG
jgi:choline kinase